MKALNVSKTKNLGIIFILAVKFININVNKMQPTFEVKIIQII